MRLFVWPAVKLRSTPRRGQQETMASIEGDGGMDIVVEMPMENKLQAQVRQCNYWDAD
jgi:hypothetical protein